MRMRRVQWTFKCQTIMREQQTCSFRNKVEKKKTVGTKFYFWFLRERVSVFSALKIFNIFYTIPTPVVHLVKYWGHVIKYWGEKRLNDMKSSAACHTQCHRAAVNMRVRLTATRILWSRGVHKLSGSWARLPALLRVAWLAGHHSSRSGHISHIHCPTERCSSVPLQRPCLKSDITNMLTTSFVAQKLVSLPWRLQAWRMKMAQRASPLSFESGAFAFPQLDKGEAVCTTQMH